MTAIRTWTSITYGTGGSGAAPPNNLGTLTYTYDADGRVTAKGGSLASVTLPANVSGNTFNADNEMTVFNGAALSYDPNGNLTADGTNAYTWNARDHLSAISGGVLNAFVAAQNKKSPPSARFSSAARQKG